MKYTLKYALWTLNGYLGRRVSLGTPHKVTILITYFHPVRMKQIGPQLRNILKCNFVEKVIVSNHNPDIRIEDKVEIRDKRLVCINQPIARPCGYRWHIATSLDGEYLIAIDDDILLFPLQLKTLFQHLVQEPEVPHGFSGMLHLQDGEFQYREYEDLEVDYLTEVYAVTPNHIKRYAEIAQSITEQDATLLKGYGDCDFIVISQTAKQNPKIHKVNRLFKSDTFKTPGIANHKDPEYSENIEKVARLVEQIRSRDQVPTVPAPECVNRFETTFFRI